MGKVDSVTWKRKDGSKLTVLVKVFTQADKKKKAPVVLLLTGRGCASGAEVFRDAATVFGPRGWAVVAPEALGVRPGEVDSGLYEKKASWRQRIKDAALTLKRLKKVDGVDRRRLVIVAAGEDHGVAAFLASRLRKRLLGLVFIDAPEASPMEGFLVARAHSKKTSLAKVTRQTRETWARALRAEARAATKKKPFAGKVARWWRRRLDRSLYKDLIRVGVPILVVVTEGDADARRRAEGLAKFLLVNGRSAPLIETVPPAAKDQPAGVGVFARLFEGALPYLWRRARPVDVHSR